MPPYQEGILLIADSLTNVREMKKILIIFILISKIGFGQDTRYLSENFEFKNGEIAYLFGNNVKLRDQPNTESNVLTLLRIGEQIEIVEKSDSKMQFDGIESPWYKVKAKDKVGFVLGSLISLDKVSKGNLTYLVSLKKNGHKLYVKTRVLEDGLGFKENISQLMTSEFSIKALGNRGLKNIKSIFEIDYLAESCGANGGGIYLFYNGRELIKAIDYTQVADADAYWFFEEYIFPNDKNGKENKIVYYKEVGETKEYKTQWTESTISKRVLEWDGNEIIPKIQTEVLKIPIKDFEINLEYTSGSYPLKLVGIENDTIIVDGDSIEDILKLSTSLVQTENKFNIDQRYKSQLTLNFDGKSLVLENWKTHFSPWVHIWERSDGTNIKKYSYFDSEYFPKVTDKDILEGIMVNEDNFGEHWTKYLLKEFNKIDRDKSQEPYSSSAITESHFKLTNKKGDNIVLIIRHMIGC